MWWQGRGEVWTLGHRRYECKKKQPLWKTLWRCRKNIKNRIMLESAIPFLGVYPKELKTGFQRDLFILMFTAALGTEGKTCPSVENMAQNTTESGSAFKRKAVLTRHNMNKPCSHYAEWNEPARERQILCKSAYMWHLQHSNSERREVECWLPGAAGRRVGIVV